MNLGNPRVVLMPVTELMANLPKLFRADKLKVMQFLIFEPREEEEVERGADVNVLPYNIGQQLGVVWEASKFFFAVARLSDCSGIDKIFSFMLPF